MRDEDDAISQIAALLRQNFTQEDEGDVAVAHRKATVDQDHQDEWGPFQPKFKELKASSFSP